MVVGDCDEQIRVFLALKGSGISTIPWTAAEPPRRSCVLVPPRTDSYVYKTVFTKSAQRCCAISAQHPLRQVPFVAGIFDHFTRPSDVSTIIALRSLSKCTYECLRFVFRHLLARFALDRLHLRFPLRCGCSRRCARLITLLHIDNAARVRHKTLRQCLYR